MHLDNLTGFTPLTNIEIVAIKQIDVITSGNNNKVTRHGIIQYIYTHKLEECKPC